MIKTGILTFCKAMAEPKEVTVMGWWQPIHDALIAAGWVHVDEPIYVKVEYGSDHGGTHPIINVADIQMPTRIKKKSPGWHDVHDRRGRRVR